MSFVIAAPEYVAATATDLANIGSTISTANASAWAPTSRVLPAGADAVSAEIAALFGAHAQAYQVLSAQAASFHRQFVQLMTGGATQYALTKGGNGGFGGFGGAGGLGGLLFGVGGTGGDGAPPKD